jgi:hypothetical protein
MPYFVAPTSHLSTRPPAVPPAAEPDGAAVPRYHKLTFATYDGTCDPLGWLNKCEQFFRGQNTREVDKTWLASYHLQDVALQWYMVLEADMGRPTWPDFRRMCQQRFSPALSTNHLAELARLPFGGSVDKYMAAFQAPRRSPATSPPCRRLACSWGAARIHPSRCRTHGPSRLAAGHASGAGL